MDGTIWLLLWALFPGFIAGYRNRSGRASLGMATAFGFANGQSPTAPRRKETYPVYREPSDYTTAITGEVLYGDAGFHTEGMMFHRKENAICKSLILSAA